MTDPRPKKPVPRPTEETRDYWEGCQRGELRLQRCSDCGGVQFPPSRFCSSCLSPRVASFVASGTGVIRTYSVVRHPISDAFAHEVPYLVALVKLREGPTMMAGLRHCTPEDVEIGMSVEVEFEPRSDTIRVPYFHPSERRERTATDADASSAGRADASAAAKAGRVSIDDAVLDLSGAEPYLVGCRCRVCGNYAFPSQASCAKCSAADVESVELGTTGELWAWTVQAFPPKSPPYLGETDPAKFEPFGVGYVALPELIVEARLTESRPEKLAIGMPMRLVTVPLATDDDGNDVVTFAFAPIGEADA